MPVYAHNGYVFSDSLAEKSSGVLYQFGDVYFFNQQYDSAIYYYKRALGQSNDTTKLTLLADINNDIGLSYKKTGTYDSALQYYKVAASLDSAQEDFAELADRVRNIGIVYKNMGNYTEAAKYYFKGLAISQKNTDSLSTAKFHQALGTIFSKQQRDTIAIRYYKMALKQYSSLGERAKEAEVLNSIGNVFEKKNMIDSALSYYRISLSFKKQLDAKSLSTNYHNIGAVLLSINSWDSGYFYLSKALELRKYVKDQRGVAATLLEMAKYHLQKGSLTTAKQNIDEAQDHAFSQQNKEMIMDVYKLNADYYSVSGDFEKAFDYIKTWAVLNDSIFNKEKVETLALRHQYEISLEQQKAEISKMKAVQNEKNSIILLFFLVFLGIFSLILMRQQKRLRSTNLQLKNANEAEKHLNHQLNDKNIQLDQKNLELKEKNGKIALLSNQGIHFTKNSLNAITGMLTIKYHSVEDMQVREVILAERLRMETIGLLYNKLYTNSSGQLKIDEYLEEIVQNTILSMLGGEHQVHIRVSCNTKLLSNKQVLDIAILLNEAAVNASKHVFQDSRQGIFKVLLTDLGNSVNLTISDSGTGLPEYINPKSPTSFGLQMIRDLAKGLGELSINSSDEGLTYQIIIQN